jgi:hypothetical protein
MDFLFSIFKNLKVKIWIERANWPEFSKNVYEVSKPVVKSFCFFFQKEETLCLPLGWAGFGLENRKLFKLCTDLLNYIYTNSLKPFTFKRNQR